MEYTKKCLVGLTVGLCSLGFSHSSEARDSRGLNGRIIGSADWHDINIDASDFFGSAGTENFRIRKKKLPDRSQELWFHESNDPNVPLLQMRYERLHSTSFSSQNFDDNFESIFNGLLRKIDVTLEDALAVEKVGRSFKLAWANGVANSLCIVGLKAYGQTFNDLPEASGDKSIVLLVCQKGEHDTEAVKNTALSFLAMLENNGRPVVRRPDGTQPFSFYEARLFGTTPSTASNSETRAPRSARWEERAIALQWDGMNDLIAGRILLSQSSKRGEIRATLPRAQGSCSGEYQIFAQQRGEWSLLCSNGLTARGDFEAFGTGKGSSGSGVDNEGRAIQFTIGGS